MPNQPTPTELIYAFASAADPQVSPDGASLAYTLGQAQETRKLPSSQVFVSGTDGSHSKAITEDDEQWSSPRWSPSSDSIALVRSVNEGSSLWIALPDGAESREISSHRVAIGSPAWAPDGQTIAYTAAFDPANPDESDPDPEAPPPVRVVRRIDYKQDNLGFLNDVRQQLWLVDVATGNGTMLTTELVDHLYPSWSPDGQTIAAKIPNRNGMHSQLGLIDVASGETELVGSRDGTVGCWSWSPSGDRLLLAADDAQTWQLDLFLFHVESGTLERLTDELHCEPDAGFPTFTPPSQSIWLDDRHAAFHAIHAGASGIYVIDLETREVEEICETQALNSHFSADDGRQIFAQSSSSLDSLGEITVFDRSNGTTSAVVAPNTAQLEKTPLADWEEIAVIRGDTTIDAWLLKPDGFDPEQTYPVILDIHGGPNSWYGYATSAIRQSLASAGYLVVFSNPRGSGSYGRDFTQAVIRDWGGGDYLDLMAVVDAIAERPYADGERIGIYGYSYGGFMTSWMIGHTDRFKAAVIGAPVVDLVSFYGTADIGHDFGPMQIGSKPHENREEYEFRSPLTYLHDAKTPTLIVHGESDDRVPISQGEQLFTTLHENDCDVEFVRYPGGTHISVTRTGPPAHRLDYLERLVDWFDRWV